MERPRSPLRYAPAQAEPISGATSRGALALEVVERGGREAPAALSGMTFGEVPFDAYVAALKDLEQTLACEARTPAERLRLKRPTAVNAVQKGVQSGPAQEGLRPVASQNQEAGLSGTLDPPSGRLLLCPVLGPVSQDPYCG